MSPVSILKTENSPLDRLSPEFKVEGTNNRFSSWVRPVISEFEAHISSHYLSGISFGVDENSARSYRETLMTEYFKSYCHAASVYPDLLKRVDIKKANNSRQREYESLSIDEQLIFEFMGRLDLISIGLMPLDRYGNYEESIFKDNHMRLSYQESKKVSKIDWLEIFMNAQEDNLYPKNGTKGELSTFLPYMIFHTYEALKRNNVAPNMALRIIVNSLPPIYQEEKENYKYWEKILNLRKFNDLIKNIYERNELENLLSHYPSTREFLSGNVQ